MYFNEKELCSVESLETLSTFFPINTSFLWSNRISLLALSQIFDKNVSLNFSNSISNVC